MSKSYLHHVISVTIIVVLLLLLLVFTVLPLLLFFLRRDITLYNMATENYWHVQMKHGATVYYLVILDLPLVDLSCPSLASLLLHSLVAIENTT